MIDRTPITLRADDSAPAPDLQATMIAVTDTLGDLVDELARLRDLMTRWGTDPTGVCRRAQPRTIELYEQAADALDLVRVLSQAYRASGVYSSRQGVV